MIGNRTADVVPADSVLSDSDPPPSPGDPAEHRRLGSDAGEGEGSYSHRAELEEEEEGEGEDAAPVGGTPADEIVSRLEELGLDAAEPRLSEEQLRANDQLQQDEFLLSLEAIYGVNVVVLDKRGGLRMFQISIVNEVPSKYNVLVELSSFAGKCTEPDGESSDNADNQDGFLYTFDEECETPCLEDEGHDVQCAKCLFSFCSLCRDHRHLAVQCFAAYAESSNLHEIQRRKELEIINNMLSLREVFRDAKQCPKCKIAISRTEGCNKMVRLNCSQFFCYHCNVAIDGYDHFKNGKCQPFPPEAIEQWEWRINEPQIVGQIQAQLNANHHRCPNCGQMNVKVGNNNHIFCWSCQNYYCALCLKTVHRASHHYQPSNCKQHTRD